MLNLAMGATATHVPYRGMVSAHQDLIGGRIDYFCDFILTALPQIQAGTVNASSRTTSQDGWPPIKASGVKAEWLLADVRRPARPRCDHCAASLAASAATVARPTLA